MIRKTVAVIALGAITLATPAVAQSGFGLVGGFVSSNATIDPPLGGLTASSRTGFAGGIAYTAKLSSNLVFAPEAMYVMKGVDLSETVAGTAISVHEKLSYVEVPALLRYMFGMRGASLFVTAGPAISFKVSCKEEQTGIPGEPASQDCNDPSNPNSGVKSSDVSVMFGAGVAVNRFAFSVRYDAGLSNVSNDVSANASTAKNKAILALVTITFGR